MLVIVKRNGYVEYFISLMFTINFRSTLWQPLVRFLKAAWSLPWSSNIRSDFLVALSLCRKLILRPWKFSHGFWIRNKSILKWLNDLKSIDIYIRGPHQNLGSIERRLKIFEIFSIVKYSVFRMAERRQSWKAGSFYTSLSALLWMRAQSLIIKRNLLHCIRVDF